MLSRMLLCIGVVATSACCTPLVSATSIPSQHADYVVVGLGAAGAGMAKFLSDDHHSSVIALETGKNQDHDAPITDSTQAPNLEPDYYATYFYQQEQLPEAFNGAQYHYTTGALWGGGSSINGEQYVQGTNENYKRWEKLLGKTWSVKKIRAAFKAFEKYNGHTDNRNSRGYHGHVAIRQAPRLATSMAMKFVQATSRATNFREILDYNNPKTPLGPFTRWQLYQKKNGRRESSSTAYLARIVDKHGKGLKKRKLTILSQASALRVLFDKHKKAIGVAFLQNGKIGKVFAKKKVILCAGVFSPKLLLHSGIGPKKLLKKLGVDVVYANNNVGRHLVNHPLISAMFTANPNDIGVPQNDPNALYVGGAFLPNPTPQSDRKKRDVQLIGTSSGAGNFVITALLLNPHSRGHIEIQSNQYLKSVLATDAVLNNTSDLNAFKNILKIYIQNIANQLAAMDSQYQLVFPTLDIINDDAALTNFIKENINVAHHWMSSNLMAPKGKGGVVDKYGHVYGVKDLVIADASIAPFPNDGNTSAPAFMIAKIIAEQLLKM